MRHESVSATQALEGRANEDVFWVGETRLGTLVVLADGKGGAAAAERAVALAREIFETGRAFDAYFWKHLLSRIHDGIDGETALTVGLLIGDRLSGTSCGDTHAFVWTGSELACLTEGKPKVRLGTRAFDEARSAEGVFEAKIDVGSRLAVVSNGVWEYLPGGEMERTLRDSFLESVAQDLVWRSAPDGRWQDDATAVVVAVAG